MKILERVLRNISVNIMKKPPSIVTFLKFASNSGFFNTSHLYSLGKSYFKQTPLIPSDGITNRTPNPQKIQTLPKIMAVCSNFRAKKPVEFFICNYEIDQSTESTALQADDDANSFKIERNTVSDSWTIADGIQICSAAPIFFKETQRGSKYFSDGGLLHHNPSIVAFKEAKRIYPGTSFNLFLSLGCGQAVYEENRKKQHSLFSWVKSLLKISTNTERIERLASKVIPSNSYFRLNPSYKPCSLAPKNFGTPKNFNFVKLIAKSFLSIPETKNRYQIIGKRIATHFDFLKPKLVPNRFPINLKDQTALSSSLTRDSVTRIIQDIKSSLAELEGNEPRLALTSPN